MSTGNEVHPDGCLKKTDVGPCNRQLVILTLSPTVSQYPIRTVLHTELAHDKNVEQMVITRGVSLF